MAEPTVKKLSTLTPDWSQLPEELLHNISKNLEDHCFDVIHARSVCSSWRSTFPFPCRLLSSSYSLPRFAKFQGKYLCTLKKVPLFLFRVRSPAPTSAEYFLGGISRDDLMELLPSRLQCSVKVKFLGSDPTLMNMLDCQSILPMGYQYRMSGWSLNDYPTDYRGVAVLPLKKEGGGGGEEFVVLLNYTNDLLVLTSAKMRWKRLKNIPIDGCSDIVTYRGRFYALFYYNELFVIDPYSLEATPLTPLPPMKSANYLVPSGNDELFLVRKIIPNYVAGCSIGQVECRVSRLDEEAGKWVEVSDLGDRVLFIGRMGNVSCFAKELPHGCGVSGNSILFTYMSDNVAFAYKYGVHPGRAENDLSFWRSRDNPVDILNKYPPVLAFRFEC